MNFRFFAFVLLHLSASWGFSQTLTWDGSQSSSWFDPGNWDGNMVPTAETPVVLKYIPLPSRVGPFGSNLRLDFGIATSGEVRVNGSGLVIQGQGKLESYGVKHVVNVSAPSVPNPPPSIIGSAAEWNIRQGDLVIGEGVRGELFVLQGARLNLADGAGTIRLGENGGVGALFLSSATLAAKEITMSSDSLIAVFAGQGVQNLDVRISGIGQLRIHDDRVFVPGEQTFSGPTTVFGGTLVLGGVLVNSPVFIETSGALSGNGVIGKDATVEGFLSAAFDTGSLTFQQDLILSALAETSITLGPTAFESIFVGGEIALRGSMNINFADGFLPRISEVFSLFDFDPALSNDNYMFQVVEFGTPGVKGLFDYETGDITITAIPEPSVAFLVLGGLSLVVCQIGLSARREGKVR